MLSHWFERGLGQIVAPDENAAAQAPPEGEGVGESLWQIVAPDPAYYEASHKGKTSPKERDESYSALTPTSTNNNKVLCEHCHRWTPSKPQSFETPSSTTAVMTSPAPRADSLDAMVLDAAKGTAQSMTSPPNVSDVRNKVFRLCASAKPLTEKTCNRLRKLLQKDPHLIKSRSARLGELVEDGYTPLLAAVAANNIAAIRIILELFPESRSDCDLQGRTALHIAGELGYVDAVDCLMAVSPTNMLGPDAPVDLVGRTPLGCAVTSPHPSARKNAEKLTQQLFSPGDASVCGAPTPAKERNQSLGDLKMVFGSADMPGFRVNMEDAICVEKWKDDSYKALLGVCDGHGDAGLTSQFIASHAAQVLRETDEYPRQDFSAALTTMCLQLDEQLKASSANRGGGTTAVLALLTSGAIVVANVGDSRCILAQTGNGRKDSAPASLEKTMGELSLKDKEQNESGENQQESMSEESTEGPSIVVKAMSEDHKPDLEQEQKRIEAAGLSTEAETFEQDGQEITIHKVKLTDMDRMAVSRTFGDYEYKANSTLSAREQAVVAVPDVVVHTRDAERDLYLILACDGVWDVMSNEEVAAYVMEHVEAQNTLLPSDEVLPHVGDLLLTECLNRGSRDNMSVVIVALHKAADNLGVSVGRTLEFQVE